MSAVNAVPLSRVAIDPLWSVNELLALHPAAGRVLNAYGIDTCCGGADSLEDAARASSVDPTVLVGALGAALRAEEQ